MTIPRAEIVRVVREPDLTRATRGVHGRGRWLVNRAGTGLVTIALAQRLPARISGKMETVGGLAPAGRLAKAIARLALRERTLRIDRLTISLEDPDGFVAAIGASSGDRGALGLREP